MPCTTAGRRAPRRISYGRWGLGKEGEGGIPLWASIAGPENGMRYVRQYTAFNALDEEKHEKSGYSPEESQDQRWTRRIYTDDIIYI